MKNTISAVVMGFGDRGQIYSSYAKKYPERLEIIGVVEPNPLRLEKAKKIYNLKDEYCFSSISDFLYREKIADVVINATMDQIHFETTLPLFKKGYDVLLEKPITSSPDELFKLREEAKIYNRKLMICHVLRYAPFYVEIKKMIDAFEIGDIVNINLTEHVPVFHMLTSYVRGKWRSRKNCGSSMLMAKCCHDTDLMCWLNNKSTPLYVSSFGGNNVFIREKAPIKSGNRCLVDCPVESKCNYSAKKLYIDNDVMPFLVWQDVNKDYSELTQEEKKEILKTSSDFGLCAYKMDNDIVDHQSVLVEFNNGVIATLNMIGGTTKGGRKIHIIGTKGEIEGYLEDNVFFKRVYNADKVTFIETKHQITEDVSGAHSGGDLRLVDDFVRIVRGENNSISTTNIEDSINGHLVGIAADLSLENKKIVKMNKDNLEF